MRACHAAPPWVRILNKIEFMNNVDCWIYMGSKNKLGYGQISENKNGIEKNLLAHRVMYQEFIGIIPSDLVIDHICRVRHCVNPLHLEAVKQKVNILRGNNHVKENIIKSYCLKGHKLYGKNLYLSKGKRNCRECRLKRKRLYRLVKVASNLLY